MGRDDGDGLVQGAREGDAQGGGDRERRVSALSALAQRAEERAELDAGAGRRMTVARPFQPARGRRAGLRGRGPLLVALALLVVVAGVVAQRLLQSPGAPKPPSILTLDLTKQGLHCPTGLSWSPDSRQIAVFALTTPCDGAGVFQLMLVVFDARTGERTHTFDPYGVLKNVGVPTPYIHGLLWIPDGRTLICFVGYAFGLVDAKPESGLLYLPLDGSTPRYVAGPAVPYTDTVVWDLTAQTSAGVIHAPIAAAVRYTWTANGGLAPSGDASQPADGSAIPAWQAGTLVPIPAAGSDGMPDVTKPPIALLYRAPFTLRSPDGRYAVFDLPITARVEGIPADGPATFDAATCQAERYYALCDAGHLPPPDKALASVAAQAVAPRADSAAGGEVWPGVPAAWRSGGKVLAAILPGDDAQGQVRVTLLRTDTGAVIGSVTAKRAGTNGAYDDGLGGPPMAWAPSGSALALYDYASSRVTIWSGSALPAA